MQPHWEFEAASSKERAGRFSASIGPLVESRAEMLGSSKTPKRKKAAARPAIYFFLGRRARAARQLWLADRLSSTLACSISRKVTLRGNGPSLSLSQEPSRLIHQSIITGRETATLTSTDSPVDSTECQSELPPESRSGQCIAGWAWQWPCAAMARQSSPSSAWVARLFFLGLFRNLCFLREATTLFGALPVLRHTHFKLFAALRISSSMGPG